MTMKCDENLLPFVCEEYEPSDCWIAKEYGSNQWLQVDLGKINSINGVAVQGNPAADEYVTQFKLSFSDDGTVRKLKNKVIIRHYFENIVLVSNWRQKIDTTIS